MKRWHGLEEAGGSKLTKMGMERGGGNCVLLHPRWCIIVVIIRYCVYWQIDVVREEHRLCYTVEMGNLCMYVCMYCMKGMTKSSSLIKVACTCVCSDKVMLSQNWAQFPPQKIAFFFVWQLEKANNVVFYRFSSLAFLQFMVLTSLFDLLTYQDLNILFFLTSQ